MGSRTVYNLPGLAADGAVAPDLVQAGNLFFTSGIRGVERKTGVLPDHPATVVLPRGDPFGGALRQCDA